MGTLKYLKAYFFSLDIAFLSKGTRQIRHEEQMRLWNVTNLTLLLHSYNTRKKCQKDLFASPRYTVAFEDNKY